MPETTAMQKIKRSEFATFMNVAPASTANYARMGKGITSQNISYNPVTISETYIDEQNARSSVDSYAPSLDGTQTCYKGDPIFEYIDGLRQARAVGDDLKTDIVLVYIYDSEDGSTFAAEKNECIIQLGDFGGEGGGNVQITYTIALNGDPIIGTATITDGTLTFAPATVTD